jgi:hypothetical protein
MHVRYLWESPTEKDHWQDQDIGGLVGNIEMDLKEIG